MFDDTAIVLIAVLPSTTVVDVVMDMDAEEPETADPEDPTCEAPLRALDATEAEETAALEAEDAMDIALSTAPSPWLAVEPVPAPDAI